jgi:hypothetical protein
MPLDQSHLAGGFLFIGNNAITIIISGLLHFGKPSPVQAPYAVKRPDPFDQYILDHTCLLRTPTKISP